MDQIILTSLYWVANNMNLTDRGNINFNDAENTSASIELELTEILLNQAGVYICIVELQAQLDSLNRVTVNTTHNVFIQGK